MLAKVRTLGDDDRAALLRAYVGERRNRRHKPGRAFERVDYRFDIVADYGAFRDLQRHRMLTIEWQPLSTRHGYEIPEAVEEAGLRDQFDDAMERSAALYDALLDPFPEQAPYAVSLAYGIRFAMQLNAREAMHMLELRTAPSGHPSYRQIGQEMHRLIAEQAGHRAIAGGDVVRRPHDLRARAPRRRAGGRGPARRRDRCDQRLSGRLTAGKIHRHADQRRRASVQVTALGARSAPA